MVTIRMSRGGAKKRPFYHLVVTDSRNRRDGRFIERVGFFNPTATGNEERLSLDQERIDHWIGLGAKPSDRVAKLVKESKAAALSSLDAVVVPRASGDDFIIVGKISGLYGVRGWMRIHSDTRPRENILSYPIWYLHDGRGWIPFKLESGRPHSRGIVAKLTGCDDRDQASELQQQDIAIKAGQLAPLEAGEYYWNQLIGLKVSNLDQIDFGTIKRMLETGGNDVMVVVDPNREVGEGADPQRLIPYLQGDVIKAIDLDAGTMVVDWDADF